MVQGTSPDPWALFLYDLAALVADLEATGIGGDFNTTYDPDTRMTMGLSQTQPRPSEKTGMGRTVFRETWKGRRRLFGSGHAR